MVKPEIVPEVLLRQPRELKEPQLPSKISSPGPPVIELNTMLVALAVQVYQAVASPPKSQVGSVPVSV